MNRLKGKVAIITGAAMGVGRATSLLFASEGAQVGVTDIRDRPGRATAKEISRSGGVAEYRHLDVRNEREIKFVFASICRHFGHIDILVNNAGILGVNKPTHELTEEEWDRVAAVNVKGVFLCTKHVIPYMREAGGGSIINLSSIYSLVGARDIPPYHASKGAVRSLTKTDAMLYAKEKIRVNSVHPGFIWTPMVEGMARQQPEGVEAFRKHLDHLHPIGHVGEPLDIAYAILYLASDESKFATGGEFVIDGGYTAR